MKTLAEELFESPDLETVDTIILKLERAANILRDAIRYDEVDELRIEKAIELLEGVV